MNGAKMNGAAKNGSSTDGAFFKSMRGLNKSFHRWVKEQQRENKALSWQQGLQEYISFYEQILAKRGGHSGRMWRVRPLIG